MREIEIERCNFILFHFLLLLNSDDNLEMLLTFLSSFDLMPATSRTLSDRKVTTEVMGNRTVDSREMVGTVYEEAVKRGSEKRRTLG